MAASEKIVSEPQPTRRQVVVARGKTASGSGKRQDGKVISGKAVIARW